MTTTVDLALRAGRMAARLGKPLSECPYDPDGEQAAEALAFVRGWQQIDGNQTASTDIHGHEHSEKDGKFVSKKGGGAAGAAASKVAEARLKLKRAVTMHGSDRSKWTAKDRAAAARLDKVIAAGELQTAIDSGAPDALAGFDRPELMKAAKDRNMAVPRGASAEVIRKMLLGGEAPPSAKDRAQDSKIATLEKRKAGLQRKLDGAEEKSRNERRNLQSDDEVSLRAQISKVDQQIREARAGKPAEPVGRPPADAAVDAIKNIVDEYEATDPDHRAPSVERIERILKGLKADELKKVRTGLGGTVSKTGKTKDQMVKDIVQGTIGFRADNRAIRNVRTSSRVPKPLTSKTNAHSLGRGQQFWEDGEIYTIHGNRRSSRDGLPVVEFDVTDNAGREQKIVKPLNQPLDRVVGGAAGGSGTFASAELVDLFRAELVALGVDDPDQYTLTYDTTSLLDQLAAVGDYDKAHGIHRDNAGRFGRGTRLGQVLQSVAGVGDDDEADTYELESGSSFDWSEKDHNGDRVLDVTGIELSDDEDDGEDENGDGEVEVSHTSGLARLHLSNKDMRRWASSMGTALLREQALKTGLDPDDPKTHLLVSMFESASYNDVDFDSDSPWEQSIRFYPQGEGRWSMFFDDDDGDSVEVQMTSAEMTGLHAQVMRQVLDDNDAPIREARAKLAARQQTAAVSAEFAMPEQLEDYWLHDPEAIAKIRWCTRGSFRRARRALLREGVPPEVVDGTVRNLYVKACGREPGSKKRGHAMASEDSAYVALQQFPTQNACGCGGETDHDELMATAVAVGPLEVDLPAPDGAPSTSTGWRGPLAPVDISTGDKRKFAPGALASRPLPLPFRWQERQERGHDGAVVVGAMTGYGVLTEPLDWDGTTLPPGTIMGEGYFLDETIIPDVAKAKHLAANRIVGPSVDLEPTMQVTYVDRETGNTFNPNECAHEGTCPDHGEAVITEATITAATLVPITAFADCRAPQLFTRTVAQDMEFSANLATSRQTAAARFVDWDDVPIAEAGTRWDPAGARQRLLEWARAENLPVEEAETDWRRFSLGFLHADDWRHGLYPDEERGYHFQIVDIIDGRPTIVPEAVFTASARIDSSTLGGTAKQEIRETLEDLYGQIAEEFGMDDELHAPWAREHQLSSGASADCGCADKWAAMGRQTAAADFDVFAGMPPYPADAFNVQLDRLTPITIEQRPGEPFARVFGHAASWKSCNRGYRGVCVPPPRSATGYSQFHLGAVRTDQGLLPVGKIVQGEGHPDTGTGARIARAFYDRTSKTTAFVRADDDKFGVKVAGVVAPGVTAEEATMLLASPPSGDWKDGEMIAVLAVNVPGHVVPRATMVDGQPRNMVAAGRFWPEEDHDDMAAEAHLLGLSFALLDEQLWAEDAPMLVATLQGEGI